MSIQQAPTLQLTNTILQLVSLNQDLISTQQCYYFPSNNPQCLHLPIPQPLPQPHYSWQSEIKPQIDVAARIARERFPPMPKLMHTTPCGLNGSESAVSNQRVVPFLKPNLLNTLDIHSLPGSWHLLTNYFRIVGLGRNVNHHNRERDQTTNHTNDMKFCPSWKELLDPKRIKAELEFSNSLIHDQSGE